MQTKTYKSTTLLNAKPEEVYEMFMDSAKHSELTESKAEISREVDGEFTVWDGDIHGKNLTLIPNKKIVQLWRSEGSGWPENHFSTVTFTFTAKKDKKNPDKAVTELGIVHKDIPEADYSSVADGWQDYYLRPLQEKFKI